MELKNIIETIETYSRMETRDSAFEVFKILDDNKQKELSFVADSDWFKHYFIKVENLAYDNGKSNTDYFKKEYNRTVPKILYHLKKER